MALPELGVKKVKKNEPFGDLNVLYSNRATARNTDVVITKRFEKKEKNEPFREINVLYSKRATQRSESMLELIPPDN